METDKAPWHAVLTGDLVDSEAMRAAGGPAVGDLLRGATEAARSAFPEVGLSQVDVFRGDSWQLFVEQPGAALRVAVFVRAWVRAWTSARPPYGDTRVAIGLGRVDRLVETHISESEGEAFVLSGHALDELGQGKPFRGARFAVASPDGVCRAAPAVAALLDALVRRWTPKQAWAVCGSLCGLTQTAIGETFAEPFEESISQTVVVNHLRAAEVEAVEVALDWFSRGAKCEL